MDTTDTAIRSLRADEDSDEVVRAVCDLALLGEPICIPYLNEPLRTELIEMTSESARRWCGEAIAARRDD